MRTLLCVVAMPVIPRRLQADHVYGRLAELARRRHRKHGKTTAGKALLANLRASSLGERRPSDHEMSTWDKVSSFLPRFHFVLLGTDLISLLVCQVSPLRLLSLYLQYI